MSAKDLRLPARYRRRPTAERADEFSQHRRDWPRAIYAIATRCARDANATTLVDLGCGTGKHLVSCAGGLEPVGIDLEPTIARCREHHATGTWITHDLDSDDDLPPTADPSRTAYACVEVIEHLERPERLLAKLHAALAPGMPAVISTPDRVRTRGFDHLGPPPNPEHAQEWTLDELGLLLADAGFATVELRHVGDPDPRTALAVAVNAVGSVTVLGLRPTPREGSQEPGDRRRDRPSRRRRIRVSGRHRERVRVAVDGRRRAQAVRGPLCEAEGGARSPSGRRRPGHVTKRVAPLP